MNSYLNSLKYKRIGVSLPLRFFFGRYPLLFYSLYGLVPKNRILSVKKNTELVIEGFPRSANTFAVSAFRKAQPIKLRIAHHMHVPAQIIRAVRWKIPTIVLIRHPKDAVVSLVMYDPQISITQALKCYISFYQAISFCQSGYIIASFEEAINNYSKIIQRTNYKFNTEFSDRPLSDTEQEGVFREIESVGKIEATRQRKTECSELNVARPSFTRVHLKQELLQKLNLPQNREILKAAEKIYSEFVCNSALICDRP